MKKTFDSTVIDNINSYIEINDLSVSKVAKEIGMDYTRLWSILFRSKSIKLSDYVSLCIAFKEPFDTFLPKK